MEKREWTDWRGSRNVTFAYSRDELTEAWHKRGQGNASAVERGDWCVVVRCSREEAILLSAMFCRRFNIPTCVTYDGATISMYCGDAGSGAAGLQRDTWAMVAAFKAGRGSLLTEDGPLFAQT